MSGNSDIAEDWKAIREESQRIRAANRAEAVRVLTEEGIEFVEKNAGAHLIVLRGKIDYWPGTGLWIVRGETLRNRGLRKLVKRVMTMEGRSEA